MSTNAAYEKFLQHLLEDLERETTPWRKMWNDGSIPLIPLRNTGDPFSGMNVLLLTIAYYERGLTGPNQWFTFKQVKELGGFVKPGAKASPAILVKTRTVEGEVEGEDQVLRFIRAYNVFHLSETDGIPEEACCQTAERPLAAINGNFARLIERFPVPIKHDSNNAYYVPATDTIHMPPRERFESDDAYLATLGHEMIHATGAPSRLCRFRDVPKGEETNREELVAEIGTCILAAQIGLTLPPELFHNHRAYLKGWSDLLKDRPSELLRAAGAASAAVQYILGQDKGPAETGEQAEFSPVTASQLITHT